MERIKKMIKRDNKISSLLGKELELESKLILHGSTRIDGHFKREILSDGNLTVGKQGRIEAHIHASSIDIMGEVHGNIISDHRVHIHAPAKVFGNIESPNLVIDLGVVFEGETRMNNKADGVGCKIS
jgi:cytoskeletal protein CcmA (bactofilin family)